MKTLTLALLLVCMAAGATLAYDRTLVTDQTEVGGFAAPAVRTIEVQEEFGLLGGGRIGVIFNHLWSIGVGGYGTVVEPTPEGLEGLKDLEVAYGGFVMELTIKPHAVFHVSLPVLVGGGQVQFRGDYVDPETGDDSEPFFVLEPEFNLEFNIARNWRLDAGVGYRHVNGLGLTDITDDDLSGLNWAVTIKIGAF
jgi:hypothetical protein